jgi:transglutaminase-like putative cysteine protease
MKYAVTHKTEYSGSEPVSVGQNQAWLRPRTLPWQNCTTFRLDVEPRPSLFEERQDYFGNTCSLLSFDAGYARLVVTACSRVEVLARNYPEPQTTIDWDLAAGRFRRPLAGEWLAASQFAYDSPRAGSLGSLREYALESFPANRPVLTGAIDLTARIHREFEYRPQSTTVSTPVDEVFAKRQGVCQDFAHLQLAMLRSLGLAARYVSGYLRTVPPPGRERLRGADASHAWISVFCGDAGWVDLDPTNNCLAQEDHLTIAWGRDYNDVPPLRGVFIGGGAHQLTVSVDVEPVK